MPNGSPSSKEIQYITPDTDSDSLKKVAALRSQGRGKLLVVIANGPSVNEVDVAQLKGRPEIKILMINKPDLRIWPTDYWALCDASVYQRFQAEWQAYQGTIIVSTGIIAKKPNSIQIKALYDRGDGIIFSRDLLHGYYIGHSTVFATLQVALWMEFERVYILGVDMSAVNGRLHFYGVNPDVDPTEREQRFRLEAQSYEEAAVLLTPGERSKFVFCSSYNPWPFLDKYSKLDHQSAIGKILEHADRLKGQNHG